MKGVLARGHAHVPFPRAGRFRHQRVQADRTTWGRRVFVFVISDFRTRCGCKGRSRCCRNRCRSRCCRSRCRHAGVFRAHPLNGIRSTRRSGVRGVGEKDLTRRSEGTRFAAGFGRRALTLFGNGLDRAQFRARECSHNRRRHVCCFSPRSILSLWIRATRFKCLNVLKVMKKC